MKSDMHNSLLERAARALCAHEGLPEDSMYDGKPMWMDFIPKARVVLVAIRKPTAQMVEAARPEIFKVDPEGYRPSATSLAEMTFVTMMDAALAEGQTLAE